MLSPVKKWASPVLLGFAATLLFVTGVKALDYQQHWLTWNWNTPLSTLNLEHQCAQHNWAWGHKTETKIKIPSAGNAQFSYTSHWGGYTIQPPGMPPVVWERSWVYDGIKSQMKFHNGASFQSTRIWNPSGTFTYDANRQIVVQGEFYLDYSEIICRQYSFQMLYGP